MSSPLYVPIVKGHQFDLQAVARMRNGRRHTKPLIEYTLPDEDADPSQALMSFIERFQQQLGIGEVFLDFYGLREDVGQLLGKHPIAAGYEILNGMQRAVTPVVGFDRKSLRLWDDLRPCVAAFKRGFCFRIDIEELDGPMEDIWQAIAERTAQLELRPNETDVLLDLRYLGDCNVVRVKERVTDFLTAGKGFVPRSFIVAGSSALDSVAEVPLNNQAAVDRRELRLWAELYTDLELPAPLVFGDYGVIYPDFNRQGSSEHINGKIRYTAGSSIHYFRGGPLREPPKYAQYRVLAERVVTSRFCQSANFSFGDKFVHDCARGHVLPQSLGPWVLADQNHHFEYAAAQTARLMSDLESTSSTADLAELIDQI